MIANCLLWVRLVGSSVVVLLTYLHLPIHIEYEYSQMVRRKRWNHMILGSSGDLCSWRFCRIAQFLTARPRRSDDWPNFTCWRKTVLRMVWWLLL